MIAVCDVDDVHAGEFNERLGGKLKDLSRLPRAARKRKADIVTIGTPDHWHVPIAIAALGRLRRLLRKAADAHDRGRQSTFGKVVKDTGKVFQVGTQQRSEDEFRFLEGHRDLVQSGRLGKNVKAYVAIGGGPVGGPFESTDVPAE